MLSLLFQYLWRGLYVYIYSPLAEAMQVHDVIAMMTMHVNPHILLFAAFCACKMNPRKTNVRILTGHMHLFFLI